MTYFEVAVLVVLVVQAWLLKRVIDAILAVGKELSFKLGVLDGSLDRINDRQVSAQVGIEQRLDSLSRPRDRDD